MALPLPTDKSRPDEAIASAQRTLEAEGGGIDAATKEPQHT